MSYYCVHQQTNLTPAEYDSDDPVSCVRCNFHGDRYDDTWADTAEGPICRLCVHKCVECGAALEGEERESDLLLIDRVAYCEYCTANALCGWRN